MPPHVITDAQISAWLEERKPITAAQIKSLQNALKPKANRPDSLERNIAVRSLSGRTFHIAARRHAKNQLDFSVRLSIYWRKKWINLIRCNGHHAPHTNAIERGTADWRIPAKTPHVHYATERYQLADMAIETFAKPAAGYVNFVGAVEYLCTHFGCCDAESPRQQFLPIMDYLP